MHDKSLNYGYADTAHFAVDKHLAGTAFADTALKAARLAVETVAMNRETSLM